MDPLITEARRFGRLTVCIATITRCRPQMLANLMQSWSRLAMPRDCDCFFLVVENHSRRTRNLPPVIKNSEIGDVRLVHALERQHGIPFARNRAVAVALEHGADVLLFIDDDEIAEPDWLTTLVEAYRIGDASLLGGPVVAKPPDGILSPWQKIVFDGLRARFERVARRSARALGAGRSVVIITSNWLADMRLFGEHGLRFDESLRLCGGSDVVLSKAVKAMGLSLQWVPGAVVHETLPVERLTLLYQFRRARDQSNASFRRCVARSKFCYLAPLASAPLRLLGAAMLLPAIPFATGPALVSVARSIGWVVGRLAVFAGKKFCHYATTTGS